MIWGLIILYIVSFVSLLFIANKHGEDAGKHNIFTAIFAYIIQFILIWWSLGWVFW